ncbi:response regulator [Butyricicoccus faecihominis]|uniref:response regulator n=1 Tax=Butyricicoccus faecihominis TaxID=1712515 RepID=UPI002479E379|nr:response regulator [Butyricicoccus faecihominis]MCQ5130156.1 response regulator [Butyricicoccus faecihominis]
MYSLFIVDDEEVIRKGIRELLQSAANAYTICGEAPDGELALPMIQELKPDIVLTDVCMPFVDGLELGAMIRKKLPWIHLLILSGHDEFEYAQKAISLGVDEYILKPFTLPQLLGSLDKAVHKIEEERTTYFAGADDPPDTKHRLLVGHLLNGLVDECFSSSESLERAQKLGISLSARQYLVCCLDVRTTSEPPDGMLRRQFYILLDRILADRPDSLWAARGDGFLVLLRAGSGDAALESAYEIAQALKHETKRLLNAGLSVGIGSVVSRLSEFAQSYRDASRSLGGLVGQPHGSILSSLDLEHGLYPRFDFTDAVPLADRLQHVSQEDIDFLLAQHFGAAQDEDQSSLLYRYYLLADLVVSSMRLLRRINAEQPPLLRDTGDSETLMQAALTYDSTLSYARKMIEAVVSQRDCRRGGHYGEELQRAKAYIREHYADSDLSLNTVAAEAGFSPNHFSTVFSQQVGQTFIEYLTRFRIEQSKRLLRETDLKLSDITYAIGYSEPHYFSYIFKKYAGVSPSIYRKQENPTAQ